MAVAVVKGDGISGTVTFSQVNTRIINNLSFLWSDIFRSGARLAQWRSEERSQDCHPDTTASTSTSSETWPTGASPWRGILIHSRYIDEKLLRHINTMSGESWSPQRRVQTRGGPGQHRGGQLGGGHHRHDGPLAQPQRHQQHPRARRRHPRWTGRPGQGGRLENFKLLHIFSAFRSIIMISFSCKISPLERWWFWWWGWWQSACSQHWSPSAHATTSLSHPYCLKGLALLSLVSCNGSVCSDLLTYIQRLLTYFSNLL